VVATPIGNLEDLSRRAERVFREVDRVACEDTRTTRALLAHLGIQKPLLRHDAHTTERSIPEVLAGLAAGQAVALSTDAGTPGLSDPGAELVAAARDAGHPVIPIPGPSAITAALSASGLPAGRFTFHGFLPKKPGPRERALAELLPGTHAWFCPARDLGPVLGALAETFPEGRVVVARELTKLHESFYRGRPDAVRRALGPEDRLGEAVVLLHHDVEPAISDDLLRQALDEELRGGAHLKEAASRVAERYGVSRRRVYQMGLDRPPRG
jgi:16S rRNA (cytidine1402-2'-O)-methyltransferase